MFMLELGFGFGFGLRSSREARSSAVDEVISGVEVEDSRS